MTTMNRGVEVSATYIERAFEPLKGNPLIEALPQSRDKEAWIKCLKEIPKVDPSWRLLSDSDRRLALISLESFCYPLPIYYRFARSIDEAIIRGYTAKNPFSPTTTYFIHHSDEMSSDVVPRTGPFVSKATGITLVGNSGTGKTSMYERVLSQYPQVITHDKYHESSLPLCQIVWLRVNVPEDNSFVTFAVCLASAIDDLLGTTHADEILRGRVNRGVIRQRTMKLFKMYWVGMLVLDEFSNFRLPKNFDQDNPPEIIALILNLMNEAGIPVLFCGNHGMLNTLQATEKSARRAENGGVFEMKRLDTSTWHSIQKFLWKLQVTNIYTKSSSDLENTLYEASDGILDYAVRGFFESQRLVIGSGEETLSEQVIRDGIRIARSLSIGYRSESETEPSERKSTNFQDGFEVHPKEPLDHSGQEVKKAEARRKTTRRASDPFRIMHPEFLSAIETLRRSRIVVTDDSDMYLLRSIDNGNEISDSLKQSDVYADHLFAETISEV